MPSWTYLQTQAVLIAKAQKAFDLCVNYSSPVFTDAIPEPTHPHSADLSTAVKCSCIGITINQDSDKSVKITAESGETTIVLNPSFTLASPVEDDAEAVIASVDELDYWNIERTKIRVNPKTQDFVTEVLTQITKKGINKTLNKHNMVVLYKKYCG